MNIEEWATIEAYMKRGDIEPLRQFLQDKQLSEFMIQNIVELIQGVKRRPRRRPRNFFPAIVKSQYDIALLLSPDEKKTYLHRWLAKMHKVSVKTIEKAVYSPPPSMSPKKKQSPSK